MAEVNDIYGSISQNLIDAGCGQQMTEHCMALIRKGDLPELFKQLSEHRKYLLDRVHARQKEIDCLDYLVYTLKNNKWRK